MNTPAIHRLFCMIYELYGQVYENTKQKQAKVDTIEKQAKVEVTCTMAVEGPNLYFVLFTMLFNNSMSAG
jgi:hypothetical protein